MGDISDGILRNFILYSRTKNRTSFCMIRVYNIISMSIIFTDHIRTF